MITIDNRTGSKELAPYFPRGTASLGHLEFADFAFTGCGAGGVPWLVGIERKTLSDLLNCISSGRLSGHQLIGLTNAYNEVYLVVEGLYRPNPSNGVLEVRRARKWRTLTLGNRTFYARDIWGYLNTLTILQHVHWVKTATEVETVQYVLALHRWWVNKDYADHRAHLAAYDGDHAPLTRHSLVRRVASQLRGVGFERAAAVAKSVSSVECMCVMTESDWEQIPGIGKGIAASIVEELKGSVQ